MNITARLSLFRIKCKLATKTNFWVLKQPRYLLLALVLAFVFFELIYWVLNLSLFRLLLLSGALSIGDKLHVIIDPLTNVIDTNGLVTGVSLWMLSVVQGVTLTVLIFTIRHQQKLDVKSLGGGSLAGILAVIGLGCPSCGTSLIAPIVALFVSGSAASVSQTITNIAMPVGLLVGLYALYAVGVKASTAKAMLEIDSSKTSAAV